MGLGGVAIAVLPSMIYPKQPFSDGLGGGNICFFWYTFLFSGVQLMGQLDTLLVFFNVFAR